MRRTAKAGRKISGQTGVAMFTSATYVWTFIWRCLNKMWQQHQIYHIPIPSLFLNIFVALIEGVFLYEKHTRALSIIVYSIVEIVLKDTPVCLV